MMFDARGWSQSSDSGLTALSAVLQQWVDSTPVVHRHYCAAPCSDVFVCEWIILLDLMAFKLFIVAFLFIS